MIVIRIERWLYLEEDLVSLGFSCGAVIGVCLSTDVWSGRNEANIFDMRFI